MMNILFETERLAVRHYTVSDQENFYLLNGNEEVMRYIRPVKSREETNQFFEQVLHYSNENPGKGRMAVMERDSHLFVGSFAFIPVESAAHMQLGYAFLPEHWGKGYATEISLGGLKYIFRTTSLETLYGYTEAGNLASQKVLQKVGFIQHGFKKEGDKDIVEFIISRDAIKDIHP
jgi:ribosomal-protein-alanine N-acetyltransferase